MKKILIIEDDYQVRENTSEFLTDEGFKVYTASDGLEGIQTAMDILPDLIVCDIMMPRKNGLEVCKTLQAVPSTSNIPFIFLTSKTERDDIRMGMQLGADDYLFKPLNNSELIKAVKIRLDKIEKIYLQSDERLFSLIDNPLIGVFIYQDNKFMYSNARLSEILGYSKEELKYLSFEDLVFNDEGNDRELENIQNCIKGITDSIHTKLNVALKNQASAIIEIFGTRISISGRDSIIGNIAETGGGKDSFKLAVNSDAKSVLSKRETEVLQMICKGISSNEIAEKLFVSLSTVNTHRANLLFKTDSKNTADLVMYAVRNRLTEF